MDFYFSLLFASLATVFVSQFAGNRLGALLRSIVVIGLGLVAALRGYVGTDTYSYHLQFETILSQENIGDAFFQTEPVFTLLALLIDLFRGDSFVYVFSIGMLQTIAMLVLIKRLDDPSLFLMFYIGTFYLNFHFNILRAATALLVILIALTNMRAGGAKFFIPLFASILFHYTAIPMIVFVLFYKKCCEKQYIKGGLIATVYIVLISVLLIIYDQSIGMKYGWIWDDALRNEQHFGIGLLVTLTLYLALGVALLESQKIEIVFFVIPILVIKCISIYYPIIGRLESFILPMFILSLTREVLPGQKRDLVYALIVTLSLINAFGSVMTLPNADSQLLDAGHSASPYIPYYTLFDVR